MRPFTSLATVRLHPLYRELRPHGGAPRALAERAQCFQCISVPLATSSCRSSLLGRWGERSCPVGTLRLRHVDRPEPPHCALSFACFPRLPCGQERCNTMALHVYGSLIIFIFATASRRGRCMSILWALAAPPPLDPDEIHAAALLTSGTCEEPRSRRIAFALVAHRRQIARGCRGIPLRPAGTIFHRFLVVFQDRS